MTLSQAILHLFLLFPLWGTPLEPARVAVLPIDLNDVSNQPVPRVLEQRMQSLAQALSVHLAAACGYTIVGSKAAAHSREKLGPGYYYAHPDLAVALTRAAGPDWVIIPRLNRASPWVADLQAHVVRVRDTTIVSNRIVEIKGLELAPELASRLTGIASADFYGAYLQERVDSANRAAAG